MECSAGLTTSTQLLDRFSPKRLLSNLISSFTHVASLPSVNTNISFSNFLDPLFWVICKSSGISIFTYQVHSLINSSWMSATKDLVGNLLVSKEVRSSYIDLILLPPITGKNVISLVLSRSLYTVKIRFRSLPLTCSTFSSIVFRVTLNVSAILMTLCSPYSGLHFLDLSF